VRSLANSVEAAARLVTILQNNPTNSLKSRLSIYLVQEQLPVRAQPKPKSNAEIKQNVGEFV
jgi:hypothetical protein